MKEHDSDVGQDLDAGWDEIAADVTSVSVKAKVVEELAEVADLDAGWDVDVQRPQSQPSRQKEKRSAKRPPQQKVNPPAPLNPEVPLVAALTKKARRELDRQNQMHAAKRKSEAKASRKQQRLANKPLLLKKVVTAPTPTSAIPNPNKKSVRKRRRSTPSKSEPQSESRVSPELSTEAQSATGRKWRLWALGVALLIVLWVAARWILSGPR
jgi:hypothetical protein